MDDKYSSWAVGWSGFASVMLVMIGVFGAIQGLVALFNDEFYVVTQEWVFEFDITAWGWIHLILGVALIASGIGILSANVAARTVGELITRSTMVRRCERSGPMAAVRTRLKCTLSMRDTFLRATDASRPSAARSCRDIGRLN